LSTSASEYASLKPFDPYSPNRSKQNTRLRWRARTSARVLLPVPLPPAIRIWNAVLRIRPHPSVPAIDRQSKGRDHVPPPTRQPSATGLAQDLQSVARYACAFSAPASPPYPSARQTSQSRSGAEPTSIVAQPATAATRPLTRCHRAHRPPLSRGLFR